LLVPHFYWRAHWLFRHFDIFSLSFFVIDGHALPLFEFRTAFNAFELSVFGADLDVDFFAVFILNLDVASILADFADGALYFIGECETAKRQREHADRKRSK
jgi:hypothetical protein